jgi:signal peptidase I
LHEKFDTRTIEGCSPDSFSFDKRRKWRESLKKEKDIKKETVETFTYIVLGILAAYLLNFGLGLLLGTKLPVVAVVSDSMMHDSSTPIRHYQFLEENLGYTKDQIDSWPIKNGFLKGDALVVIGASEDELKIGDVIVYEITGQNTPIVHRIVKLENGEIITKGDHNPTFDPWRPKKIYGKAVLVIPFLGWPKVLLTQILGGIFR